MKEMTNMLKYEGKTPLYENHHKGHSKTIASEGEATYSTKRQYYLQRPAVKKYMFIGCKDSLCGWNLVLGGRRRLLTSGQLTTTCNPSSRGTEILLWPPRALVCMSIYRQIQHTK